MDCANDVCQDLDCRAHGAQNRMILSMGEELDELYEENARLKRHIQKFQELLMQASIASYDAGSF